MVDDSFGATMDHDNSLDRKQGHFEAWEIKGLREGARVDYGRVNPPVYSSGCFHLRDFAFYDPGYS